MTLDDAGAGDIRASDAERDAVVGRLREHAADGRLTLDEFTQRVERALRSRTHGELDAVLADLPAVRPPMPERSQRARRWFVGVMSAATARGRWRAPDSITAVAVMGGCHLDFRRAIIDSPEVVVTAVALMGGIEIVVPEGVEVSLTGLPVMGGKSMHIADVPVVPSSPRIVVRAFPVMGGVSVRSKRDGKSHSDRGREGRRGRSQQRQLSAPAAPAVPAASVVDDSTVTIMFSDVCGFSELTERLGDAAAYELLREHNRIVRAQIEDCGGHVVKTGGDGFMVTFPSVARGLRCAAAVQRALEEVPKATRLQVHIGVHAGEVVRDGADLLGQAVNIASRLSDAAGPDEVLVSAVARELVAGSREFSFAEQREVMLKGVGSRVVYPLDWRPAPAA